MSKWRPISEAPKDGSRVLGWIPGQGVDFIHWQDYGPKYDAPVGWRDGFVRVFASDAKDHPTHFMPLPSPPNKQE